MALGDTDPVCLHACWFKSSRFAAQVRLWPHGTLIFHQVRLWPPDAMAWTEKHRQAAQALYADEGGWHVMTRKHGGGPAWRWKQAGCVTDPGKRLQAQRYNLLWVL